MLEEQKVSLSTFVKEVNDRINNLSREVKDAHISYINEYHELADDDMADHDMDIINDDISEIITDVLNVRPDIKDIIIDNYKRGYELTLHTSIISRVNNSLKTILFDGNVACILGGYIAFEIEDIEGCLTIEPTTCTNVEIITLRDKYLSIPDNIVYDIPEYYIEEAEDFYDEEEEF